MKDIDYQLATKLMNFESDDIIVEDNAIGDFHRCFLYYPSINGEINEEPDEIWAPSIDINHAWEIVEYLKANGHNVTVGNDSDTWECLIFDASPPYRWEAEANTAPMAICKAALKLIEEK